MELMDQAVTVLCELCGERLVHTRNAYWLKKEVNKHYASRHKDETR